MSSCDRKGSWKLKDSTGFLRSQVARWQVSWDFAPSQLYLCVFTEKAYGH